MSKAEEKHDDYVKHWLDRVDKSTTHFDKWKSRFKCDLLNDYYEGYQTSPSSRAYVLNLFYSSIKIKRPSLIFSRPTFTLSPKPWKIDWNPEIAFTIARLKQDTLNSFIQDSALKFAKEIEMALLDSWFYFGLIEVGYAANWIENPNAGKPVLKSDYYDLLASEAEGKTLTQPDQIPEKERIYFRRIPAHRFRVGGSDSHDMERCNWVGYYEFVRTQDILASRKYLKNVDEKDWPGGRSDDYYHQPGENPEKDSSFVGNGDYTKLWKIWDLRSKTKLLILESQKKCILKKKFERLPLFGLKFDERRTGWYPIPLTYNWKGPQDEINESREQARRFRRRVRQFWQAMENSMDPDEVDKFVDPTLESAVIWTKRDGALKEIPTSPMDSSIFNTTQIASDEFDKVSGTSNNQRGLADRVTATEANTVETRTRIREEADQSIVAEWLCNIGKEALLTVIERFSESFWIKRTADEQEIGEEIQSIQERYQLIHSAQLDDNTDFDVDITVSSMSPVTNAEEEKKLLKFLAVIKEFDVISLSPTVIREVAFRLDYRNEQVIKSIQRMAQLALMAKVEEGQNNMQAQGAQRNPQSQAIAAQATPPNIEEIRNQLQIA